MKIANLLCHYPASGGTTKAVRNLSTGLANLGHDVEVWTFQPDTGAKTAPENFSVLRFRTSPICRYLASTDLSDHVRAHGNEYDFVFLNGMFNLQTARHAALLRRHRVPYVLCPHDPYHPMVLEHRRLLKALYRPVEKNTLENALCVQLLSSAHIPHLRNYGITASAIVVSNAYDPAEFDLSLLPERPARTCDQPVRLLYLGRIDTNHKGLDLLLNSFAEVSGSLASPPLHLTLQGTPTSDLNKLKSKARRLRISDNVSFLPPDFSCAPFEIIHQHDVAVLSSRFDGFSYVILEAMLAATPVVVSSQAGIAEHVREAECGIVTDPADLSRALREIIRQRDAWPGMGLRGRAYAQRELTLDAVATAISGTYRGLLGRGVASGSP